MRFAVALDAAVTGAVGAVLTVGASGLDGVLGVPAGVLYALGALFLAWAVALGVGLRRGVIAQGPLRGIISMNALCVLASAVLVAEGWSGRTTAGTVVLVVQAIAVVGFVELQLNALRAVRRARA